jgi:hypothetical protein
LRGGGAILHDEKNKPSNHQNHAKTGNYQRKCCILKLALMLAVAYLNN